MPTTFRAALSTGISGWCDDDLSGGCSAGNQHQGGAFQLLCALVMLMVICSAQPQERVTPAPPCP